MLKSAFLFVCVTVCLSPALNDIMPTLHFDGHFSRWTLVSRYQNVSILDFVGAKGDVVVTTGDIRHAKLQ